MADEQYELYQQGTAEALADWQLDNLARQDGYYAQMTVGAADNLTGRGDAVPATYLHRTAGGTASIESGQATVESIHGRSLRWNQHADHSMTGFTKTRVVVTADGNVSTFAVNSDNTGQIKFVGLTFPIGHKVLVKGKYTAPENNGVNVGCYQTGGVNYVDRFTVPAGTTEQVARILTTSQTADREYGEIRPVVFATSSTTGVSCTVEDLMVIDLTQMFGAGNEPSTVAEFESLYPESYYPYDAGSLLPVRMEGIETTGFNQWDEQWEVGTYNASGAKNSSSSNIRSAGYIPAFPSTDYYMASASFTASSNAMVNFYDTDKNFISRTYSANTVFTTPADCRYVTFYCDTSYGTTYNHDICINLSWSGIKNGEYEEHWKSQRAIPVAQYFPDGMRGAGSVYDELTEDAAITRVGEVDLGTLKWTKVEDSRIDAGYYFRTVINDSTPDNNKMCQKYPVSPVQFLTSVIKTYGSGVNRIMFTNNTTSLHVIDSAYTDAAAFNAALSGVMLHYALATPTTTPIDPPLNLTYRVDDWGTERVMVDETQPAPQSAPPTMQVAYGVNAIDTLRNLPKDYVSAASDTNLCAALASALGLTITRTWDATKGEYDYAITQSGE